MLDAKKYLGEMLSERYLIKREIGRGASSIVFYAEDMLTSDENGRPIPVAIKLIDKDAGEYKLLDKSFETEIRAVVNMPTNPHVVDIHDVSFEGREHYIVMEYVKGKTLRDMITEKEGKPFSAKEIVSISLQILQALRNAHESGIVHRDIKPQNILVQSSEEAGLLEVPGGKDMPYIKLADFGIALLPDDDLMKMKNKGVGTVHYVSPEQASGGHIDHRSDLYSLGVVMYEMATSHVPFDAKSATGIIQMHRLDEPFHVRNVNKEIPLKLDQIIFCAMQKNPADRFRDAAAMEKRLKEVLRELSDETEERKPHVGGTFVEKQAVVIEGESWNGVKRKVKSKAKKSPSGKKVMKVLVPTLCAVLAVGLIAFGVLFMLGKGGVSMVKVPGLVGSTYAESNAYPDGISVRVVKESSETVPAGVVIRQSPGAGALISVEKGGTVELTLYVSTGYEVAEFFVPEVARTSESVLREYLAGAYRDADDVYSLLKIVRVEEALERDDSLPTGYVLGLYTDTGIELDMDGDEIRTKTVTNVIVKVNPSKSVVFEIPEIYRFSGEAAKSYVEETYPFFTVTVEEEIVMLEVVYQELDGVMIPEYRNADDIPSYCFKDGILRKNGYVVKALLAGDEMLSLDGSPYEVTEEGVRLVLVCVRYNEVPYQ